MLIPVLALALAPQFGAPAATDDACDVAISVYAALGTKTITLPPGSQECLEGCQITTPIWNVIRQEYGYKDNDWPPIRARQEEIVNRGTFSFSDWEDPGVWIHGSKLMAIPSTLPPCLPTAQHPLLK